MAVPGRKEASGLTHHNHHVVVRAALRAFEEPLAHHNAAAPALRNQALAPGHFGGMYQIHHPQLLATAASRAYPAEG
jgi:hypothetical protein